jgi:hypothetical protein
MNRGKNGLLNRPSLSGNMTTIKITVEKEVI